MSDIMRLFYEKVKSEPCIVCGRWGVDAAHLLPISRPLGFVRVGYKAPYRDWSSRSHKGPRGFMAVPLCKKCHDSVHAFGEGWLEKALEDRGGAKYAYAYSHRLLAEAVVESCGGEDAKEEG